MKYGYFDAKAKEYVIKTYETPLPWINYLGNEEMFSIISNLGGGYHFYKDARKRRITRFQYNTPTRDDRGRMIYIVDGDNVFSPTFFPAKTPLDHYECHVGVNYTRFSSSKSEIFADLLFFIPRDANIEIAKLILKNTGKQTKTLQIFSGVEFCLWEAQDDSTNFQRNFSTGEVEVEGNVIYHKTEYRERRNHFAYLATNKSPASFDTSRDDFLGRFGDYSSPKAVKEHHCFNSFASGWSPVAFFQQEITLQPGEETTLIYLLGYFENPQEEKYDEEGCINKCYVAPIIERYLKEEEVDNAFTKLRAYYENKTKVFQVSTLDKRLELMANVFHPYQCLTTFRISRSASYYESGIGRGMGFRDSCQDLLGFIPLDPSLARQRILDLASIMKDDGSTYHQYQPLDKKGNEEIGSGFNDDPLWIIASAYAYLSETGDKEILSEEITYESNPDRKGTLLEHLEKAIQFTLTHLGPHGLPLIGHADWNDCLNLNCFSSTPGESFQCHQGKETGVAESIFIAAMFVKYGREFAEILNLCGRDASSLLSAIQRMEKNVYTYGFEEDHFLRAYDAFSHKVGSNHNEEGQIYIEPQGMCVFAGLGKENGMARKALDAVYARLNTKYGLCLLSPCYHRYHPELGEISSYPPGYKENGGIFCHNNLWVMIAECLMDNGKRAFEYYKELTPIYFENEIDIHKTEPYAYAQMVAGIESPHFGEAKNSWLSGTASWSYLAIRDYFFGIRPILKGLLIDPKIDFEAKVCRIYRGCEVRVHIKAGEHKPIFIPSEQLEGKTVYEVEC